MTMFVSRIRRKKGSEFSRRAFVDLQIDSRLFCRFGMLFNQCFRTF
jgi:hypothetical protein